MAEPGSEPIPGPKPAPVVGNIPDLDSHAPLQSMMKLAREYGPIFRLELPGREMIVVSSQELVNELCDQQRFDKKVHAALRQVRDFAGVVRKRQRRPYVVSDRPV